MVCHVLSITLIFDSSSIFVCMTVRSSVFRLFLRRVFFYQKFPWQSFTGIGLYVFLNSAVNSFQSFYSILMKLYSTVTEYMGKTHSDSYVSLHRLLYNSQGVGLQRKGNVRKFNGFDFDKDSKLYSNKLAAIK